MTHRIAVANKDKHYIILKFETINDNSWCIYVYNHRKMVWDRWKPANAQVFDVLGRAMDFADANGWKVLR